MNRKISPKKPWLAALLNIVPGLGYLYLDRKRVFGWLLLTAIVVSMGSMLFSTSANTSVDLNASEGVALIGSLLMWIAFMVDAYKTATTSNDRIKPVVVKKHVILRNSTQHRRGLIGASLVLLLGSAISLICWSMYYYGLGSILFLPTCLLSILTYHIVAKGAPYGQQAWHLVGVLSLGLILILMISIIPDIVRWHNDAVVVGTASANSLDLVGYYFTTVIYTPTWLQYKWEIIQSFVILLIVSAPLIVNAQRIKTEYTFTTP